MHFPRRSLFLLPLALAACGNLPQPFAGNPGATARRLAQPPPARLAVAAPATALLTDDAGAVLAGALATALQAQEVPAVAIVPTPVDWRLVTTAELDGQRVVPVFTVQNPAGVAQGSAQGRAVDGRAWASGAPATLRQVAEAAAPDIAALLTRIEAARQQSDPSSLVNRPARVFFKGVRGAPGDGNLALSTQMRTQLPNLGLVVQDTPRDTDFVLEGIVAATPSAGKRVQIEITWVVNDAHGTECGKATQFNEVPAGLLDGFWGDVAVVAAREAAGGVHDIINNRIAGRSPGDDLRGHDQAASPRS